MTPALQPAQTRAARLSPQAVGWWLGALGVLVFALTIPMTRLASGSLAAPQLPAVFVAIGRAALAGLLAALWLLATRAPWPRAAQWRQLALTALGGRRRARRPSSPSASPPRVRSPSQG
jgi:hypothetical protein